MSLWTINGSVPLTSTAPPTTQPGTNPGASDGLDVVVPAPNAAYVNCISETSSLGGGRSLAAIFVGDKGSLMSVDYCAALAKQKNYAYFGLEYGSQCLLGDVVDSRAVDYGNNKCNMACKANSKQYCGGSGAISVYNNTDYTSRIPKQVKINNTEITYEYRGCYADNGGARTIGGQSPDYILKDLGASGSVDTCLAFCQSGGFTWAGIEYGSQCFCNKAGLSSNAQLKPNGDLDCNMPCKGDVTENCGQSGTIQVYQVRLGVARTGSSKRKRMTRVIKW